MATAYLGVYSESYPAYGSTPQPGVAAPTNLRKTASTSSTLTLAWDAVAGTYTLQRAPVDNQGNIGTYATIYTGTAKTYQDGGLTYLTTYAYRVKVTVNGVDSNYSLVAQATTAGQNAQQLTTPAQPTAGAVTATTIPFTTPVNANATGYRFQLATNAGFTQGLVTSPAQTAGQSASTVGYTFTGLTASTSYYGRVMLIGDGTTYTDSQYSAARQVSTLAAGTPQELNGILKVGQSNNGGKAKGQDLDVAPLQAANLRRTFPNFNILNPKVSPAAFQPLKHLVNDLALYDSTDCGVTPPGGGSPYGSDLFGSDMSLADRLESLYPGVDYYEVKKTADGQPIASVLPGGGWRADFHSRIQAAQSLAAANNKTWVCRVVIVQFGEADAGAGTDYGSLLVDLRNDLLSQGFITTSTIFVQVGLKDTAGLNAAAWRTKVAAWVNADPTLRRTTDASNYQGIVGDEIHLDGVTQDQIGNSDVPNAWLGTTGGRRIGGAADTAPAFQSFTPQSAPVGKTVDITGSGFYPNMGVSFQSVASGSSSLVATVQSRTGSTEVFVQVPALPLGQAVITLTNGTASVTNDTVNYPFVVTPPPPAKAVRLNGGQVAVPVSLPALGDVFTLELAIRSLSTSQAGNYVLSYHDPNSRTDYWALLFNFASKVYELFSGSSTGDNPRTAFPAVLTDTVYHNLKISYNKPTLTLTLDGVDATFTKSFTLGTPPAGSQLYLGVRPDAGAFLGEIGVLRVTKNGTEILHMDFNNNLLEQVSGVTGTSTGDVSFITN